MKGIPGKGTACWKLRGESTGKFKEVIKVRESWKIVGERETARNKVVADLHKRSGTLY